MRVLRLNPLTDSKFDQTIGINRIAANSGSLEKRVAGGVALKDIACLLIPGYHDACAYGLHSILLHLRPKAGSPANLGPKLLCSVIRN